MPTGNAKAALKRVVVRLPGRILLQHVIGAVDVTSAIAAKWACRTAEILKASSGINLVDCLRAGLVDIEKPPEAVTLGAHIAQLDHHFVADLLLDVQVVVLHVRRLDVAIEGEGIAL